MNTIIVKNPKYLKSVFGLDQMPDDFENEVAFIGKSNVGKSSLINFLLASHNLAHVSRTPGRTRGLNLFDATLLCKSDSEVNQTKLCHIMDLPGIGYAKLSHQEKEMLSNLLTEYLNCPREGKLFLYLIDSRRDLTKEDIALSMQMRQTKQKLIVVATKSDQIPLHKRKPLIAKLAKELSLAPENCVLVSAHANMGRELLLNKIWDHVA